jgi:hypothetical protein
MPTSDLKPSDLKAGTNRGGTAFLCGALEPPGKSPIRFVYSRWYGGGYWRERLLLAGDGPDFDYYTASYCKE